MPLPEWLRQKDEGDEPQPGAAAPVPDEEPEDQALEDQEPGAQESGDREREDQSPEDRVAEDEVPPTGNDQVLGMLAAIEQQLRQLGDVQRQHEDQLASLIDRSGPPADAEAEAEVAEVEPPANQPSFVVEMDDHEQTPRGAKGRQDLEAMASELETSRQQTEQMQQQLEETQARIKAVVDQSDGGAPEEKTEELEEAHRKIEALRSRVIELEAIAAVGDDDTDAGEHEQQIAALNEQVAQLQEELRKRATSDTKPVAAPPDSAGAEMIERQRTQIERLTEQLAALNAGVDPREIQERDARIAELEEELQAHRDQGAGKQGVSKLVAGFGGALRQARGKKGSGDGAEVAELEERVAELEVQCKRFREEAERANADADKARQLLEQRAAAGEGSDDAQAEEIVALRARVAELESSPAAAQGELRSKIETELRQQWNELKQRQDSLAAAEEKMRRRWARPQAVVVFGWLVGLAIVVAIVSWLMAGRMFPATIAASVSVEAKSRTGLPVSDEDKANWQQVHTAMLADDAFRKVVAKRLADQRFDDYKDPDALAERLEGDLTVDSPKPGAIMLTLAGTDQRQTTALLDTLATTLAMWSSQQAGKRGDGAVAFVRGERREGGHARYATIKPAPIRDRRAIWSVIIFVMGFVISASLISRIFKGLLKTRSAMAEDDLETSANVF